MHSSNRYFVRWLRVALAMSLAATQTLGAAPQQGTTNAIKVTVEKGQVLEMQLMTPVDSATAKLDDPVALSLTRPLLSGGKEVLPEKTVVNGHITKAVPAGDRCHPGRVEWKVEAPKAADGTKINLRGISVMEARPCGVLLDRLPPEKDQNKFGRGILLALLSPILLLDVVLMAPFFVMDYSDSHAACTGPGKEEVHPDGELWYAAVKKSVKVTVQP